MTQGLFGRAYFVLVSPILRCFIDFTGRFGIYVLNNHAGREVCTDTRGRYKKNAHVAAAW